MVNESPSKILDIETEDLPSKKVFIKTFGCQMNEYDSQKMLDLLKESHYHATTSPEEADLIVLNTCSIRDKAQEKVFDDLGRIRQLKQKKPSLIIAVGGCVASQEGDNIMKRAHYVDIVFGPQTLHRLPHMVQERERTRQRQIDISFPEIEKFDKIPVHSSQTGAGAFVSIMEGCSKYCSYCVVPYTRGEEISRPVDDILFEIVKLIEDNGVKEITLLGQNVNAYLGTLHNGEKVDFAFLLEVIHSIPGLERIRYTTSHPKEMTTRLIQCYEKLDKLVSHLHLPVQSGSDRILNAMKRGYTVLEYKSIIKRLRAVRPHICLSSDFIVGFPGETAEDFQKTVDLIRELEFDFSFTFIYSKRPGTPAAQLPCHLTQEEKVRRLQVLQELLQQKGTEINRSMVGSIQPVLVEGQSKRNPQQLSGRTDNNRIVHFDGPQELIKTVVPIKITEALPHCLRGQWLQ